MNPQTDLYSNISEIRDTLDTLLKRGKPASVADLQALVTRVEAQSRPTLTFPAPEAARLLAPQLLPLLPTPDNLVSAGKHAAALIETGIATGTDRSIAYIVASVRESTQQLTAATVVLAKAAEMVPRSVPVDFLRGWGYVFGLMLGPLTAVLLFLWGLGAFSGVAQAKYDQLQQEKQALMQVHQQVLTEGRFYLDQVQRYRKKFPKTAAYFPKYVVPTASTSVTE